ncbi:MAG: tetratricopeptide repeat protein, partial [Pseudomonadales bacterium]|nr:tetratricopeptide repeat protein [Pseudomonadales bacterium]
MKYGLSVWLSPLVLAALFCGSCATGGATNSATADAVRAEAGVLPVEEIDEKPGSTSYYLLVAGMAMQKELYDIAAENYRKAALSSDDEAVAKQATEVCFELARNDDARLSAERWRKLNPKSPEVHAYLARLYVRDNNAKAAAKSLRALIELSESEPAEIFDPVVRTLSNEENSDVAMVAVERLVARYKRLPQAHYALGIHALRNAKFEAARASANKAIALDKEWAPAHLLLARVMIATGDVDNGIEYAGEHIGGANSAYERLEYGILLAAVDRDFEAGMILQQVLDDDPTNVAALRALGILDLKAGDLDLAERRFTALLSTGRVTFDALYYLASIAETREQDQRAYKLYSEVKSGDNAVLSQLRAANILYRAGQLDGALQH